MSYLSGMTREHTERPPRALGDRQGSPGHPWVGGRRRRRHTGVAE